VEVVKRMEDGSGTSGLELQRRARRYVAARE